MVKIDLDAAIIGMVFTAIKNKQKKILINCYTICEFTKKLEDETNISIINNFSTTSIAEYLRRYPNVFIYDVVNSKLYERPTYYLNTEARKMGVVKAMIKALDPRLNYPIEILQKCGFVQ